MESNACPDCGLVYPKGAEKSTTPLCVACVEAMTPEPAEGWPVRAQWINAARGRGVRATRNLEPMELVERCWVTPLSPAESEASAGMPVLNRYTFPWDRGLRVLITGNGLLYNFDRMELTNRNPNLECALRRGLWAIEFRALRSIHVGEELTWDYRKAVFRSR